MNELVRQTISSMPKIPDKWYCLYGFLLLMSQKVFWKVQFLLFLFIIFLFPLLVWIFSHSPSFLV